MIQHHPRILVILATGCVLLLVTVLVGWFGVFAAGGPSITISPTSGLPASSVSVSGTGFRGKETVSLLFDAGQLGSVKADASGAFTSQMTVPSTALPGAHTITATGQKSGKSAQATFQVTQNVPPTPTPSPTLPSPTPTLPPPPPQTDDWAMYGFDASHTGANPNEHILSTSTVANLSVAWSGLMGSGVSWSEVAVAGGILFAESDKLYAFDASTGTPLWTANITSSGNPGGTPAVANGIVYAASIYGTLNALNAQTGALIWTDTVATNISSESAPVVASGVVYEGWDDGNLYAFNAQTGAELWSFHIGSNIVTSPTVVNGTLYLSAGSLLYVLDANTGTQLGSYPLGSAYTTPAVAGGIIYLVTNNAAGTKLLDEWDAASGALLRSVSINIPMIPYYASLAIANNIAYLYSGDLYAFDVLTGATLWQSTTGDTPGSPASSPIVANGVVYTGSVRYFYAYDAQTGALLWSHSFSLTNADTTPVVVNGTLYVMSGGTNGPAVYALR